jgi:glycosyltransferase involved in cell wall biosynthesis
MTPEKATICLNMIVKDEARVIVRCLESVKPFIDYWVICDTGSTDNTRGIIRDFLKDIPGELYERPWQDFGHNRTEALGFARGKADYALIIDADEVMLVQPDFQLPALTADEYQVRHEAGNSGTSFYLPQLVRLGLPWHYEGVLHEAIICATPHSTERLAGLITRGYFDGARNVDPQRKYQNDAALLEKALKSEPSNTRYVFYLAQSYRDAGNLEKSLAAYERRANLGGWAEEVWYSLYQSAILRERLKQPRATVTDSYLRAYQFRPARAEPLCELARYYRQQSQHALSHLFASVAIKTPRPDDSLFLDDSVYDWRAKDEYATSLYWVGKPKEALNLIDDLLADRHLPLSERARVKANREYCVIATAAKPVP